MVILILLSIHTLFCVWRVYVLVEVGTFFIHFLKWRGFGAPKGRKVFWNTQGCSKTSKLLTLLRGGKLGGSLQIYIKEGAGILLFQLPWQESFQSKPSLWFFAQLNWTFLKKLWWSNGCYTELCLEELLASGWPWTNFLSWSNLTYPYCPCVSTSVLWVYCFWYILG